jgi:benzoyl-CoA reductase/2-hydroxyglutaryl-CoA dehydratase subunit BcrC/BadD/HgdB
MENKYLREFIQLLKATKKEYSSHPFKSIIPYLDLIINYHERADQARKEGKPLVAHLVMCPIEIFYAMDIVPFFVEIFVLFNTFLRDVQNFLEIAAGFGLPPEVCSAHRATDAMVLSKSIPKPDFFVYTSQACDNTPKSGEGMAELYGVPFYLLDRPYNYTPENYAYYVEEIKGLIEFLEAQTGHKMDYDRLREIVMKSWRVTELCLEINQLRKIIPEPLPCEGLFAQTAVLWTLAGTDEAIRFYEGMVAELKERVKNKVGVVAQERFRLLFPFVTPFWDMSIMDWMQERHGAVIAIDLLNIWGEDGNWLIDPDKPIESLALKTFLFPGGSMLHGPITPYKEAMVRCAKEYHIDGAVFFSHIGCRQACGTIRTLKDILQEQAGVPMINVDCDLVDKTFASREEQLEALEGFFEMLEEKKQA